MCLIIYLFIICFLHRFIHFCDALHYNVFSEYNHVTDPQNLVNADPDPGRIQDNKITNLISNNLFNVKKKKSNLYLNLLDMLLFYLQT